MLRMCVDENQLNRLCLRIDRSAYSFSGKDAPSEHCDSDHGVQVGRKERSRRKQEKLLYVLQYG